MLRSSLGFHTITLSLILDKKTAGNLIRDFRKYSQDTGLIKMYFVNGKDISLVNQRKEDGTYETVITRNKNLKITYYQKYKGIEWLIRYNDWSRDFKSYIIEVTINPKILSGINDYISAATYDNMEAAIKNFNLESEKISFYLKTFESYSIKRVDYCINFSLNELAPGCSPEQIMKLIKRSDIPPHYEEWKEYDATAHRTKSKKSSFYLINPSVNINCYMKHVELQERSQKYESRGYPQITPEMLDESKYIIRFEVQCKYQKMYASNRRAEESGNRETNKYESLLSNEACHDVIDHYFKKSIGRGDWYTMQAAIRMVQSHNFNTQKEKRLIDALKFVNECHSLVDAKSTYQGDDLKAFKRTLSDLSNLGINPVTIPKNWGIKHLPNLLYAYSDKVHDERLKKENDEFWAKELHKYIKKYGVSV